jgi:hypothetical protein
MDRDEVYKEFKNVFSHLMVSTEGIMELSKKIEEYCI